MPERKNPAPHVRIAVIGMGYWGKNLVRNFHELGALARICDSNRTVEASHAAAFPSVRFGQDYAEVLADPDITAVALATPAVTHFEMASAALLAGKDVFVEKPLAIDVAEGAKLHALARAQARVLMVGHILRYHPAVIRLQQLIAAGALGKLHYVYSSRLNIGKIRAEENILWSFAPHDISVILGLLQEVPDLVTSHGDAFLNRSIYDVTLSHFRFPSGISAHIFVSWLHPVKEQRLVVIGSERMAVFDDTAAEKLVLYPHRVEWVDRVPMAVKAQGEPVALPALEPLREECLHFLECVAGRKTPTTDGAEGQRVLRVLDACQRSLLATGAPVRLEPHVAAPTRNYFVHPSACVDEGAEIGAGTKVWHFSHLMKGARIGARCVVGQNVNVDGGAVIGNNVKIQNNVSVYSGVTVEDDVFLGPSCVLTNVANPRSQINRHALYESTVIGRGCTVGANATIVCGVTLGRYAFVGAGAVVTKSYPDYALVVGNPARQIGWMSRHGHRLVPDPAGGWRCPESGYHYEQTKDGRLRCLDLAEDAALPAAQAASHRGYRDLKPVVL